MTKPLTPDDVETMRCKRIGDGLTLVAVGMTTWAGWHLGGDSLYASLLLAALMGLITYGLAHLLTQIDRYWQADRRVAAGCLAGVALLFFFAEYNGHLMFNVGHRKADIEQAQLQDTRYDDTRSSVDELKFKKQTLEKQKAKLEDAAVSGWNSTKPTAAWQADITNLEGDKLFKRSNGCANVTKSDSRAFCNKLTEARANLAVAQSYDDTVAQLKATDAALLGMRDKSAGTHKGESITADSTKLFAQISTGSLAPAATALAWTNIGLGGFISLISSIGAFVYNWLGSGVRAASSIVVRPKEAVTASAPYSTVEGQVAALRDAFEKMQRRTVDPVKTPAATTEKHTHELVVVEKADQFAAALRKALQEVPALKAA